MLNCGYGFLQQNAFPGVECQVVFRELSITVGDSKILWLSQTTLAPGLTLPRLSPSEEKMKLCGGSGQISWDLRGDRLEVSQ